MTPTEIKSAVNSLDKARNAHDTAGVLDILKSLDESIVATEQLLRETKVGVYVNKLKTYDDASVVLLVKKIIKKWKDQVSLDKKKKKGIVESPNTTTTSTTSLKTDGKSKSSLPIVTNRTPTTDGVKIETYPDTTRNRSIGALYTAIGQGSTVSSDNILNVSTAIEIAIFTLYKENVNDQYRNKLRSLILNLKNKNNLALRTNVLSGKISPDKLIHMTSAELAPDALKKEMEELHQKNLFDAQGAVEKRAVTDRFVCGKCKQREVSYYQMQTRSADEPLTTFCTCEKCGNRWKFC